MTDEQLDHLEDLYEEGERAGCPVGLECETCGATWDLRPESDLEAHEADTPVGTICLTLCGDCFDDGAVPRLSLPKATLKVIDHQGHLVVEEHLG